jgi:hypothetical protein
MSRTYRHGGRRIRVRGIRRPTDLRRLARVLIELERAKMEAEAEAEHEQSSKSRPEKGGTTDSGIAAADQEDAA